MKPLSKLRLFSTNINSHRKMRTIEGESPVIYWLSKFYFRTYSSV